MASMYDENEGDWDGSGLSRQIAKRRLAERNTLPTGPSGSDRALGAVKGALGGASTGAAIGSVIPGVGTAIGAGVGALVGGAGGALTASPSEKGPSAEQMKSGARLGQDLYDQYKKAKQLGPISDLGEDIKDLSDLGSETGMV